MPQYPLRCYFNIDNQKTVYDIILSIKLYSGYGYFFSSLSNIFRIDSIFIFICVTFTLVLKIEADSMP